jgi:hypothetical protein
MFMFIMFIINKIKNIAWQVWSRLLHSGTFWMGLLLLIAVISGKDVYMCALGRSFDPKPFQVIQEVCIDVY